MRTNKEILLEVHHLSKLFPVKHHLLGHTVGEVYAVNDVSFTIGKGDTLPIKIHHLADGKEACTQRIYQLQELCAAA